jgi:hypothetical protein
VKDQAADIIAMFTTGETGICTCFMVQASVIVQPLRQLCSFWKFGNGGDCSQTGM